MTARDVNDRQLDVLRWIVNGCPARQWENATYKTVAVALQNRRLATVSRKHGVWHAEATDAGRYYVEHEAYPIGHWTAVARPGASTSPSGAGRATRQPRRVQSLKQPSPPSVAAAESTGEGHAGSGSATPTEAERPIRVPARMSSRPHQAVKAIQDSDVLAALSKPLRSRVLRILDALAKEAERRGYEVEPHQGRLRIVVRGHGEVVDLREPTTRTKHIPTEAEIAAHKRTTWLRPPEWDSRPSGRLRAVVDGSDVVEPKPRKDGTMAWVLEDRLDRVLGLVEDAAARKEAWERRRREAAEAKRQQWEEVRAQAVQDFQEHRRVEALRDQVERWQEGQRLGGFVLALDDHIATLDVDSAIAAREWRQWVVDYLAQRSPFARPIRMPRQVEPSAQDLAPFMRGLSPYGAAY